MMTPTLAYRLWIWFRDTIWGKDLGRVRRYLIIGILATGLLGVVSKWAKPRLDEWLYPPPPAPLAACTEVSVFTSGIVQSADVNNAKKWVHTDVAITLSARVWNPQTHRNEFWMTDQTTIWMIEFVCYDTLPGHHMVFGEFETAPLEDVVNQQKEYIKAESEL